MKLCSLLLLLSLLGCQNTCPVTPSAGPGPRSVTTVKADVRVALDTCSEDRAAVSGSGDYATLDCSDGGAGAVFRVLFPRKQWQGMRQDGVGLVNAGPGK